MTRTLIVIPCREHSQRLPGKALLSGSGKTLVQHTYEAAKRSKLADRVVVATDSQAIHDAVSGFGGLVFLSKTDHDCGTSRVAELARTVESDASVVINLQADEPLVRAEDLDQLIQYTYVSGLATLVAPLAADDKGDLNVVKASVMNDECVYFSRLPIYRGKHHVGVYGFTMRELMRLDQLEPTKLAKAESLEQLTWIEAGRFPHAVEIPHAPLSINSPDDYRHFVALFD